MKSSETSFQAKILSLAGVFFFVLAAVKLSAVSLLKVFFPLRQSSPYLVLIEQHFWFFAVGFIAIIALSRGHLWSFGINSKNLKVSMKYVLAVYIFTIALTIVDRCFFHTSILPIPKELFPLGTRNSVGAMLVYWMTAPVANTIVFFGFGQTLMMKYFEPSGKPMLGIPYSVVIIALLFTGFSSAANFPDVGMMSVVFTMLVGIFNGYVYWKTESLIAPMLGQAFFFGFPLFIHIMTFARI